MININLTTNFKQNVQQLKKPESDINDEMNEIIILSK